ncbi:hypothetical protein GGR51DRAFT_150815 [Nemania sp. FL0031]|nr:hypothetical protein GGR51DRAFT_150815 [Nemania sp. FL0031]
MMPTHEDSQRLQLPDRKYVAWNFLPLQDNKGTIEFRQPPHVTNFKEAEMWIKTCLFLCYRAMNWKW